jgi:hypothetical protein
MGIRVDITEDDIAAGRAIGATGCEVVEFAINRALDGLGIPREGRSVTVTYDRDAGPDGVAIVIDMPPGYEFPD